MFNDRTQKAADRYREEMRGRMSPDSMSALAEMRARVKKQNAPAYTPKLYASDEAEYVYENRPESGVAQGMDMMMSAPGMVKDQVTSMLQPVLDAANKQGGSGAIQASNMASKAQNAVEKIVPPAASNANPVAAKKASMQQPEESGNWWDSMKQSMVSIPDSVSGSADSMMRSVMPNTTMGLQIPMGNARQSPGPVAKAPAKFDVQVPPPNFNFPIPQQDPMMTPSGSLVEPGFWDYAFDKTDQFQTENQALKDALYASGEDIGLDTPRNYLNNLDPRKRDLIIRRARNLLNMRSNTK